jgi:hypothetical protein
MGRSPLGKMVYNNMDTVAGLQVRSLEDGVMFRAGNVEDAFV